MNIFTVFAELPWYLDKTISLAFGIVQSLIIAFLTFLIVNHAFAKRQKIGTSLNKEGVQRVTANNGRLSKEDENILFGRGNHPYPTEIKLCFLSGFGFVRNLEKDLTKVLSNGCDIKLLVADPRSSHFYKHYINKETISLDEIANYYTDAYLNDKYDDSFIEKEDMMIVLGNKDIKKMGRESIKETFTKFFVERKKGDMVSQILEVVKIAKRIKENATGANVGIIQLRFFKDEYRMPITLAKFDKHKNKPACTMLWTNITAPNDETSESINMYFNKDDSEDGKFVTKIEEYFDYIWDYYNEDQIY